MTELIEPRGPWKNLSGVELATAVWELLQQVVPRGAHLTGEASSPRCCDTAGLSARCPMVAAMVDIEVRSRMPGRSGDDLPAVLVQLADDHATVRELIRRTVEEQIRELRADAARCRRILDRQYLSDDDLRTQAGTGAIRMPPQVPADPDVTAEVARAHRAFARGTFVVFVGGRQVVDLDEEVALRLGEPVVFLRLVALAGG